MLGGAKGERKWRERRKKARKREGRKEEGKGKKRVRDVKEKIGRLGDAS